MPSTTFYNLKYSRQKELLHSAMRLFSEKHYDDWSVRSLSKEMEITTGAFYRYFGSKEEFYIFMIDYTLEQFWETARILSDKLGRKVEVDEVRRLDRMQDNFWKLFDQSSMDIRMKYYFRTKDNPLYQFQLNAVSEIKNADTYGEEEREVTAFTIAVLQYIVTSFRYLEHRDFDDEKMFQTMRDMLLRGFKMGKESDIIGKKED